MLLAPTALSRVPGMLYHCNKTYLASEVTLDNSIALKEVPQNVCVLDPDEYSNLLAKVSLWEYAFYHLVLLIKQN